MLPKKYNAQNLVAGNNYLRMLTDPMDLEFRQQEWLASVPWDLGPSQLAMTQQWGAKTV